MGIDSSVFSGKLDLLLRITESTNIDLGKALGYDGSNISRFRKGRRLPSDVEDFSRQASRYFVSRIKEDKNMQQAAEYLLDTGPGLCCREDRAVRLLAEWMTDGSRRLSAGFFAKFPAYERRIVVRDRTDDDMHICRVGADGRREVVLRFLRKFDVEEHDAPLMFFINEDTRWFHDDPAFQNEWMHIISRLLKRGIPVDLIIGSNMKQEELIKGIFTWLPLFSFGRLHIYSFRGEEGFMHGCLFLAPDTFEIDGITTRDSIDGMPVHFTTQAAAIAPYEKMFRDYLAKSYPVFGTEICGTGDSFLQFIREYESKEEESYFLSSAPSAFLLSERLASQIELRCGNGIFRTYVRETKKRYAEKLKRGIRVNDCIVLPERSAVKAGKIPVLFGALAGNASLCYTREEYASLLKAAVIKAKHEPNYRLSLIREFPEGLSVSAVKNGRAYIVQTSGSGSLLTDDNPMIAEGLTEYFRTAADAGPLSDILTEIEDYIDLLEVTQAEKAGE